MAVLRNKNIIISLILMCLIMVSPIANAQLGGLVGGLGGLGGLLGGLFSIFNIQGLLMCSINGSVSTMNATSTPFPNAGIVLQCAGQNVSSTRTSASGIFSLPTIGSPLSPSAIPSCMIIVTTPLNACNASLPAGNLVAPLFLAGAATGDRLNIFNFIPGAFGLVR